MISSVRKEYGDVDEFDIKNVHFHKNYSLTSWQ